MALSDYLEWNRAIVHAVTAGVEKGLPVYLDTDVERLGRIGVYQLGIESTDQATKAFLAAVCEICTCQGSVDLTSVIASDTEGLPKGVAFLAVLVLAAYDMADDELVAANNFFIRLRARLALSTSENGRPNGLDTGLEVRLWHNWNQWLVARGWVPTAYPGQGAVQFIQYARSQTLLRLADRHNLINLYSSHNLLQRARRWDAARHLQWLSRHADYGLTANVRSILKSPDLDRRSALGNAVAELVEDLDPTQLYNPALRLRRPRCGLYRSVHPLTAEARYLVFMQVPRDLTVEGASIVTESGQHPLRKLKGLWTRPLEIPDLLTSVQKLNVVGLPGIDEIPIPERDHWTLVRDPDAPLQGDYATWRAPELGEDFILLGRSKCQDQLDILKEEGVLDWHGQPHEVAGAEDWLEWYDCKILSPSWDHINPVLPELFDELRPSRSAIGIGFFGGLPGLHRGSWMHGYPPSVRSAVFRRCCMRIRSASCEAVLLTETLVGEQTFKLPDDLPAGDYLLEVFSDDKGQGSDSESPIRVRTLHIIAWDDLSLGDPDPDVVTTVVGYAVQGARIRRTEIL